MIEIDIWNGFSIVYEDYWYFLRWCWKVLSHDLLQCYIPPLMWPTSYAALIISHQIPRTPPNDRPPNRHHNNEHRHGPCMLPIIGCAWYGIGDWAWGVKCCAGLCTYPATYIGPGTICGLAYPGGLLRRGWGWKFCIEWDMIECKEEIRLEIEDKANGLHRFALKTVPCRVDGSSQLVKYVSSGWDSQLSEQVLLRLNFMIE